VPPPMPPPQAESADARQMTRLRRSAEACMGSSGGIAPAGAARFGGPLLRARGSFLSSRQSLRVRRRGRAGGREADGGASATDLEMGLHRRSGSGAGLLALGPEQAGQEGAASALQD
jgi:hypothetical protein